MPLDKLDTNDKGDDVQRRFRYQYGYGAILLTAALLGKLPIAAIYCEQADDILAQLEDGSLASYQVKTGNPQDGRVTLKNTGLIKALTKWVELERKFPREITKYRFVSNLLYESRKSKLDKSPIELIQAVGTASSANELNENHALMLNALASKVKCDSNILFAVLKKAELVSGPGLDTFASEISHDHLSQLPTCSAMSANALNSLRDELMQKIHSASSLDIRDSSEHWTSVLEIGLNNPVIRSKLIEKADVEMMVSRHKQVPLLFAPGSMTLRRAMDGEKIDAFTEKLIKGDLSHYLESLRIRKLGAELRLMELGEEIPDKIDDIENQIACFVKGVCDDAHLQASESGEPFGKAMLRLVQDRVGDAVAQRPGDVCNLPFEILMGVAGLLTEECKVWWSEPFELSGRV